MGRRQRSAKAAGDGVVSIAGYVAIQLPGDPTSSRWVYLRPHAPGILFVANLPSHVDTSTVRQALPSAGPSEDDIVVQPMPGGASRFARVRMRNGEADVRAALEKPADFIELDCFEERGADACPPRQWLEAYWNARDTDAVQRWSAATMETYERAERTRVQREKAEAEAGAKPDGDGFVMVRRGASAVDAAAGVSAAAFNASAMERRASIKKKRTKGAEPGVAPDGFYRWQRREGRKRELDGLRKRFEDDKKRVAAVRNLSVD